MLHLSSTLSMHFFQYLWLSLGEGNGWSHCSHAVFHCAESELPIGEEMKNNERTERRRE